jgi:hypothetical protein
MTMRFKMTPRYEMWRQAIEQLQSAAAQLDQAHASLRDADLLYVGGGWKQSTIKQLATSADELLAAVRGAECPECDHLIAGHGEMHGCNHDRDAAGIDPVLGPLGPCCCGWGLQRAAAPRRAEEDAAA